MRGAAWTLFGWVVVNQLGVPVPLSPSLIGAGFFASSGEVDLGAVLAVAVAGTLIANIAWFMAGRWRGARLIERLGKIARRSPEWMQRAEDRYRKHRVLFLFAAPFLPEVNPFASGLAGALGMRLSLYLACALGSALVYSVIWVGAGYLLRGAL